VSSPLTAQLEEIRRRRRAQLEQVLQGQGAPQVGALAPLPQGGEAPDMRPHFIGSLLQSATGGLLGKMSQQQTPQAQQMQFSLNPPTSSVSGTPGGKPLSPPQQRQNQIQQLIAKIQALLR